LLGPLLAVQTEGPERFRPDYLNLSVFILKIERNGLYASLNLGVVPCEEKMASPPTLRLGISDSDNTLKKKLDKENGMQ